MEIRQNRFDAYANLVGVYRLPGDSNRTLLRKVVNINSEERGPTSSFIQHFIATNLDLTKFRTKDIYTFYTTKTPLFRNEAGSDIPFYVNYNGVDLPVYRGSHSIEPSFLDIPNTTSSLQYVVVFGEDKHYLSRIVVIYGCQNGIYQFRYTTKNGDFEEILEVTNAVVDGDVKVFDFGKEIKYESYLNPIDQFIDNICPNKRAMDLLTYLDSISPSNWGHSNINIDVNPKNLGHSYPTHFDADIDNSEYLYIPTYNGISTKFKSGVEAGSFRINSYRFIGKNIELICNPGIVTYRNQKLFIGKVYSIIKNEGVSFFDIPIKDSYPVDIIKISTSGSYTSIDIPSDLFIQNSLLGFKSIVISSGISLTEEQDTELSDIYNNSGVVYAIAYLLHEGYFITTGTSMLFPGYVSDTSIISSSRTIASGLFGFGIPFEINPIGFPIPRIGSAPAIESITSLLGYSYEIIDDFLRIYVPNDMIENSCEYVICLPDSISIIVPYNNINSTLFNSLDMGVSQYNDNLKDIFVDSISFSLLFPKFVVYLLSETGSTLCNAECDIWVTDPETGLIYYRISDNIGSSSVSAITTFSDNSGKIELNIDEDLSLVESVRVTVLYNGTAKYKDIILKY